MTIDPDNLTDRETEIYEAGFNAGEIAAAQRLRGIVNEIEAFDGEYESVATYTDGTIAMNRGDGFYDIRRTDGSFMACWSRDRFHEHLRSINGRAYWPLEEGEASFPVPDG